MGAVYDGTFNDSFSRFTVLKTLLTMGRHKTRPNRLAPVTFLLHPSPRESDSEGKNVIKK